MGRKKPETIAEIVARMHAPGGYLYQAPAPVVSTSALAWRGAGPADPQSMAPILAVLEAALATPRFVNLAYSGGSRPGQARRISVRQIIDEGRGFLADEPGFDETKTYATYRVLWIEDDRGVQITNAATTHYFNERKARAAATHSAVEDVIHAARRSSSTPAAVAATWVHMNKVCAVNVVPGDMIGAPKDCYRLSRHIDTGMMRSVVIDANGVHAASVIADAFNVMIDHGGIKLWDFLPTLLRLGFRWPAWWRYKDDVAREAEAIRERHGGLARLRDMNLPQEPEGRIASAVSAERFSIYDGSQIRPPTVESDERFFDRLRFFESGNVDLDLAFAMAARVPEDALAAYLLEARESGQVQSMPSDRITEPIMRSLQSAALLTPASTAPLDVLLTRFRKRVQARPIKAIGCVPPARDFAGYRAFYESQIDGEAEKLLRQHEAVADKHVLMPPSPWTWEQLQDFRCCYIQSAQCMLDWLCGATLGGQMESRFLEDR